MVRQLGLEIKIRRYSIIHEGRTLNVPGYFTKCEKNVRDYRVLCFLHHETTPFKSSIVKNPGFHPGHHTARERRINNELISPLPIQSAFQQRVGPASEFIISTGHGHGIQITHKIHKSGAKTLANTPNNTGKY